MALTLVIRPFVALVSVESYSICTHYRRQWNLYLRKHQCLLLHSGNKLPRKAMDGNFDMQDSVELKGSRKTVLSAALLQQVTDLVREQKVSLPSGENGGGGIQHMAMDSEFAAEKRDENIDKKVNDECAELSASIIVTDKEQQFIATEDNEEKSDRCNKILLDSISPSHVTITATTTATKDTNDVQRTIGQGAGSAGDIKTRADPNTNTDIMIELIASQSSTRQLDESENKYTCTSNKCLHEPKMGQNFSNDTVPETDPGNVDTSKLETGQGAYKISMVIEDNSTVDYIKTWSETDEDIMHTSSGVYVSAQQNTAESFFETISESNVDRDTEEGMEVDTETNPLLQVQVSDLEEASTELETKSDEVYNISHLFSGELDKRYKRELKKSKRQSWKSRTPKKRKLSQGEEEKEEKMDRKTPVPNYFVSIQITNPKIHEALKRVQEDVVAANEKLKPAMNRLPTLHLTLLVLHLSTDEELERSKLALDQARVVLQKQFESGSLQLDLCGLGNFRDEVVFAKVHGDDQVSQLKNIARVVEDCFLDQQLVSTDKRGFKPHVTIMKLTFAKHLRTKGIKKIDKQMYSQHADASFGCQTVDSLQLCAMRKKKDASGYYQVDHCVHIGKSSEVETDSMNREEGMVEDSVDGGKRDIFCSTPVTSSQKYFDSEMIEQKVDSENIQGYHSEEGKNVDEPACNSVEIVADSELLISLDDEMTIGSAGPGLSNDTKDNMVATTDVTVQASEGSDLGAKGDVTGIIDDAVKCHTTANNVTVSEFNASAGVSNPEAESTVEAVCDKDLESVAIERMDTEPVLDKCIVEDQAGVTPRDDPIVGATRSANTKA